jgi:hypothetical protein
MKRLWLPLLLAGTAFAAPLEITMNLRVGDEAFNWGPQRAGNYEYTVDVVRFYVSEMALVRPDGSELALPGLRLVNFPKDGPTQNVTVFKLDVPAGTYAGLRFTVGVPRELNHLDAAKQTAPLGVGSGMYWSWNSGYIFYKFEGKVKVEGKDEGFLLHMGSDAFRIPVNLSDLMRNSVRISIPAQSSLALNLDLGRVLDTRINGAALNLSDRAVRTLHGGSTVGLIYLNMLGAFSLAP